MNRRTRKKFLYVCVCGVFVKKKMNCFVSLFVFVERNYDIYIYFFKKATGDFPFSNLVLFSKSVGNVNTVLKFKFLRNVLQEKVFSVIVSSVLYLAENFISFM